MTSAQSETEPFEHLAESRRDWINSILRPWCQSAATKELRKAEQEWLDIAGRVDVHATLWTWAWERFPELVHPELPGVNETHEVVVELSDGRTLRGFPDNRASRRGVLVLVGHDASGTSVTLEPIDRDAVISVRRC